MARSDLTLDWKRFGTFAAARTAFRNRPCVYVQTDRRQQPLRIGSAAHGLEARYRGATGNALDAAMHESGNLVFAAAVHGLDCERVRRELMWQCRDALSYARVQLTRPPRRRVRLHHAGECPRFPPPRD